jgi:hypothetical protein
MLRHLDGKSCEFTWTACADQTLELSESDVDQMSYDNSDFVRAFPSAVQGDALRMVSSLPPCSSRTETFHISIEGETELIPYRIYRRAPMR